MSLRISRVLHAGYIFETTGKGLINTKIIFDPIFENPFSRNCYAYPDVSFNVELIKKLNFDAIFISHFHDDHCSFESLDLLNRKIPIYVFCIFEELFLMLKSLGFENIFQLEINKSIHIGSIEVIPRRALDSGVDSIFQIKTANLNILNVVDSWIEDDVMDLLVQESPWDMIMWPFQSMKEIEVISPLLSDEKQNGIPQEHLLQIKKLNPRYIVPSSCQFNFENWSWYNNAFFSISYKKFESEIYNLSTNVKVIRMDPSVTVYLSKSFCNIEKPLDWINIRAKEVVDYEYDSNVQIPTTAAISKKFPELKSNETEFVINYCLVDLIYRYNSLEVSFEKYFNQNINWKLSVYDHVGAQKNFYYKIINGKIIYLEVSSEDISWLTEIPISRLYGALMFGESLTSLYLRINDFKYSEKIKNEIKAVDISEDPLLRCLYTGLFGSYQKSQLVRLKK